MATYAALLRAVNVAGRNTVAMSDLKTWAAALGLSNPRTLLQSGNLFFETRATTHERLEARLEEAARRDLDLATDFFVRSLADWHTLIAANPFPREAENDPGHLVVMCLKHAPPSSAVTALQRRINGRETLRAHGPHLFIVYPDGIGRSRLTTALIERTLETRGTARNWNTVLRVGESMGSGVRG